MPNEPIIEIADLELCYRDLRAVAGLSLTIYAREVFGLLGPNGAGKTSTLACIEGLRQPAAGSVRVAGHAMPHDADVAKRLLGVQLQTAAMFPELTLTELVELYAALYSCFPTRAEIAQLLERFGLAQKHRARAGQLSGGQQQRLALALATVNDPQIVLLDEPTTGLDPQARRGVWAIIRRMQDEGRTVVLTTHSMEEAQSLCDRIGIIDAGKLVALGTPSQLIARHAPPLAPGEAARRQPNLEDVFIALTGRSLGGEHDALHDEEAAWLASLA
ncbi:MAG: ABC transporter ATP-binding protein [Kouleothrix sp.]|jgi:ABC-2 type transport system ATP-binding protein|nr:ABC transporter ATP-binding protein [Kouleothrix sp.]